MTILEGSNAAHINTVLMSPATGVPPSCSLRYADRLNLYSPLNCYEKTEGMFGTLVITLPSAYRGGELRIRHAGREVTVDTSATGVSPRGDLFVCRGRHGCGRIARNQRFWRRRF